jgi:hypothetical protein
VVDSALIGDIAACSNAEVHLDIDIDIVIAAHAGIERVEVRDGLTTIAHVRSGDAHRRTGSRIRIQCEGAEYRGGGAGSTGTWRSPSRARP